VSGAGAARFPATGREWPNANGGGYGRVMTEQKIQSDANQ
jgi:hypothetical protein